MVRTNTRHPPPPPHDVIIHHAHHQPAAGEVTHDNLGLQRRHDSMTLTDWVGGFEVYTRFGGLNIWKVK